MQKQVLIGLGIIVAILGTWFFLFDGGVITNYPPKNEKIVAFGDSLVFGVGATEGNDFVSVLERSIGRDIINLGVSGDTTEDGLDRLREVLEEDPGTVLLLLGGNDYLRRIPKEKTRENLETLIEAFISNGSVVVLLGVRGGILIDGREEIYKELSKEYKTVYVEDVLSGIFLNPELMFDSIHPNDVGYAIIAERLVRVFTENEL